MFTRYLLLWLLSGWLSAALAQPVNQIIRQLQVPDGDVLVIAHRGDWRNAPENSLLAIQHCIEMGVDIVEVDVRRSQDGHFILMHDERLDRTTNGGGKVSDWTLDSLRTLRLRNGTGRVTQFGIPTLEEALRLAKGRIMVNLDKSYEMFPEIYEVVQRTGTGGQILMKGKVRAAQVQADLGEYLDEVFFMPIVDLADPEARAIIAEYEATLSPVAYEFLFHTDTLAILKEMAEIQAAGARPWVNAIFPQLCAHHDDNVAVSDLASSYDWLLAQGFNMIQTDRPALLIDYLHERKRQRRRFHSAAEIRAWMENPTDDYVLAVSHRGDWRYAPENSLAAVQRCIDLGVEIVEIDVRMTQDSHLVVMHDLTLDRTTNGTGLVSEHTLADIKALRLKNAAGVRGSRQQVPTLEEVMRLTKDQILVNIDKTERTTLREAYEVCRRTGTVEQAIFKGNDPVDMMRATYGSLMDSIIYMPKVWYDTPQIPQYIANYERDLDPMAYEMIFDADTSAVFEAIPALREQGNLILAIALWDALCAGHTDEMALQAGAEAAWGWLIDQGAHAIMTDRPAELVVFLKQRGLRE